MSKRIYLRNLPIGGGAPVSVQAMAKSSLSQGEAIFSEVKQLIQAGADAIRVAVKVVDEAKVLRKLIDEFSSFDIPFIADVHFNYKVAIESIKAGVDGLRLNPGNISDERRLSEILKAVFDFNPKIVIRVGVNSGSLPESVKGLPKVEAMVQTAQGYIKRLEDFGFYNIKVSIKSSDVRETIIANRLFSRVSQYPIHLGVTATGTFEMGIVKSAIGIGALLVDGIGDTLRVSLSGDSVSEVKLGKEILKALSLRLGVDIISCPTCGRCNVNLTEIVKELNSLIDKQPQLFSTVKKIAVMGCEVNGPGEACEADIGVAYAKGYALLFKAGKVIRRVEKSLVIEALKEELSLLKKVVLKKEIRDGSVR